ncbi:hypothetical protein HG530_011997 [Fusarium avenaceum]|nr:hypothetical protein HG530_011997 [Fusarium avenaceum]
MKTFNSQREGSFELLTIALLGLSTLPLRLLGGLGGSSPLGVGGGSTPLLTGSAVPASGGTSTGGTGEASSGSLPVGTSRSLEAGLDGGRALLLSAGDLLLLNLLLGLSLRVAIDHDVPGGLAVVDGTTEAEDLTGEHPPDGTNGVATLVVGGDGDVNVLGGRVSVGKGNDGDVDVRSLLDGLGIGTGVGDDDQTGLLERSGDVVGERTGGEATSDGGGTSVGSELEDGTLTVRTGRDDTDIGGVVDGSDDTGSQDDLLPEVHSQQFHQNPILYVPGLANVDHVNTILTGLPEVVLHVNLEVLGAEVALSSQEGLNVLAGGVEDGGKVGGSHLDGFLLFVLGDEKGWLEW